MKLLQSKIRKLSEKYITRLAEKKVPSRFLPVRFSKLYISILSSNLHSSLCHKLCQRHLFECFYHLLWENANSHWNDTNNLELWRKYTTNLTESLFVSLDSQSFFQDHKCDKAQALPFHILYLCVHQTDVPQPKVFP